MNGPQSHLCDLTAEVHQRFDWFRARCTWSLLIASPLMVFNLQSGLAVDTKGPSTSPAVIAHELPDAQDLLLLGPVEPTRVRLRIEIDGVPFRTAWRDTFGRLFDQFDTDRDGSVSLEQAGQIANIFGTTAGSQFRAGAAKLTMDQMAAKATGLTKAELRAMLEESSPPIRLSQKLSSQGAGPALSPLLDYDGDGRLSRQELSRAATSLHGRDFNDDQLITELELVAGPDVTESNSPGEVSAGTGTVILLTAALDHTAVAEILLSRYDRNRDGVISLEKPAEIQSESEGLASLDTDGDHLLTRAELRGYLELPLDAELPLVLGSGSTKKKGNAAPRYRLRGKLDGGFRLQVGSREVNLRRSNRNPNQEDVRVRMADFDANNDGSLDATEFTMIVDRPDFAVIDTNHDDKISLVEFDSFFQHRSRATAVQVLLEATEQGADLFRLLDLNGDRVLTPRELLLAPNVIDTEDQDRDGFLGGAEMTYNLILEISRAARRPANANLAQRGPSIPRVKADREGPAWFLKMDRNRDGDVSLSEFPGSHQIFGRLDTNGDGLISSQEATASTPSK
ncbi:hypothetical protein [Schlesneria paludicola]|uniref:hypothetical protein n=1 Tax=Schlesneria paludicola TaxID=360056 RepID=UPI00029AA64D|nr:hypothetical protein [Schlesneria paludicola]